MKFSKIFFTFLFLAGLSQEARSAEFHVDQTDSGCADDGSALSYCTITAAVDAASPGDKITIAAGTYVEADIYTTKPLNITGAGVDQTIIDATGGYGFYFDIDPTTTDPTLVVSLGDLSINNGDDPAIISGNINVFIDNASFENQMQGAISFQNDIADTYTLSINNSQFLSNSTPTDGGAIYADNGNLVINNSLFFMNTSFAGGAIYSSNGNITITGSNFNTNSADTGGAIYQSNGNLSISSSTSFETNSASTTGGALYLREINLEITDSDFKGHSASSYAVFYKDSGTTSIVNSTFTENTSTSGPALYQNISSGTESSMIITKTVFEANDTTNGGSSAVVAVYGSALIRSSLEISDSTFDTNSNLGDDTAGDFVKAGVIDVGCYTNATIKTSTFYNNTGKNGGAIYIDKCDVDGDGSSETLGVARVINSTFSKNITTENGGAIYNDGILILENVTIANNESISANGGGLYDPDSTNTSIHNSILANNIAPIGPDCFSSIHSEGYNIVSDSSDCTLTNDDEGILDTDYVDSDANLNDALADNGGATKTLSLNPGSLALNTGSDCRDETGTNLTTSQNGLDRPQGSSCDRGAFEGGCGDGVVQSDFAEECDDENIVNGDGCDNTCKIETATTTSGDSSSGGTTSSDTTSGDTTAGDTTSGDTTSGDTGSDDSSESTGGESTGTDDSGASTTTGATDSGTSTGGGSDSSSSDTSGSTTSGSTSGSVIDLGQGNSNATDGGGCSFNSDNL